MSESKWRRWLDPSRILPSLTIVGAATFLVMSLVGLVRLSLSEGVVISLLTLIAIDSLIERLRVLERIEARLEHLTPRHPLRGREIIIPPDKFAVHASSIHIIAVSAVSITAQFMNFYERKLHEGCRIQLILLQPDKKLLELWNLQQLSPYTTKLHIESNLQTLSRFIQSSDFKGSFELRLSKIFLPYSMVGIDFEKSSAAMIVEYHTYKTALDQRPHIVLTQGLSPDWFNSYRKQFEQAWDESQPFAIATKTRSNE